MRYSFIFIGLLVIVLNCGAPLHKKAESLHPGATKSQVKETMGEPADTSFRGESEAWQYMRIANFGVCEYRIFWFDKGQLVGTTSYRKACNGPGCTPCMKDVRWEEKPDTVIEVRPR